ncbi:MAG: nucleoside deaminase [Pirellulaceae bacterium]
MKIELTMPAWAVELQSGLPDEIKDVAERMKTVIEFSRQNFEHDTGGPFAAGVFEKDSGRIVAIGVNLVVPSKCSSAHAEIMALSLAQQAIGNFDLGATGIADHQLVVNARPCAMCLGAVVWSGVRSVACAASGHQIEELTGFDEGPVHPDWKTELEQREIEVIDGLMAEEACAAFREFATLGRTVYNARSRSG